MLLAAEAAAYARAVLPAVSRTFALNIPRLPPPLDLEVTAAYLLCRIADTIEDESTAPPAERAALLMRFAAFTAPDAGDDAAAVAAFVAEAAAGLRAAAAADERALLLRSADVLAVARGFSPPVRAAIHTCVTTMCRGMGDTARRPRDPSRPGLADWAETAEYCYYVAGTVGELLTALFAHASPAVAARVGRLAPLAVPFGRVLQVTNILKDVIVDAARGAVWLPAPMLERHGFSLTARTDTPGRAALVDEVVARLRPDMDAALAFALAIPPEERGMRLFCLWPLFMAVLTLRRLRREAQRPVWRGSPKIGRTAVRAVTLTTRAFAGSDIILRTMFGAVLAGLPPAAATAEP